MLLELSSRSGAYDSVDDVGISTRTCSVDGDRIEGGEGEVISMLSKCDIDSSLVLLSSSSSSREQQVTVPVPVPTASAATASAATVSVSSSSSTTQLSKASRSMKYKRQSIQAESTRSILDPSKRRVQQKKIADFKSGRLNIASLKLHGREHQIQILNQCLQRIRTCTRTGTRTRTRPITSTHPSTTNTTRVEDQEQPLAVPKKGHENNMNQNNLNKKNDKRRSLVLLHGYSGTGKTALAKSFLQQVEDQYNNNNSNSSNNNNNNDNKQGLYVSGKFDMNLRDEPYFGIMEACREMCGAILMLQYNHHHHKSHRHHHNHRHHHHNQNRDYHQSHNISSSDDDDLDDDYDDMNNYNVENDDPSSSPSTSFVEIQNQLIDALGVDIYLLMEMIPELEEIVTPTLLMERGMERPSRVRDDIGTTTTTTTTTTTITTNGSHNNHNNTNKNPQETQAKLHYNFRIFLRVITSFFATPGPVVMVLDDLQWADIGSLELMEVILTDSENSNLMIVGLYRSNEVNESHPLQQTITNLYNYDSNNNNNNIQRNKDDNNNNNAMDDGIKNTSSSSSSLEITELTVGNLDLEGVKAVTMDLLSLDDDTKETQELATLFYNRTQGNVFFLISFIAMLEEERLIDYDLHQYRYTWDIATIQSGTIASANVVDMMKTKMSRLPPEFGSLLSIAAFLGASFDLEKLEVVWKEIQDRNASKIEHIPVQDMISIAMRDGFIERGKSWNTFRWIHDKVQEAAKCLIPTHERSAFQIRVGTILCKKLSHDDLLETSLFLVMNLLNESSVESIPDEEERVHLAMLNLRATKKSVSFSAFSSASKYAKKGIEFLPNDCWRSYYKLSLELYSYAAEAANFLGNDDETIQYCDAILDRTDIPMEDKFRANIVKVVHMCGIQQHKEATKLLIKVLKKFDVKIPKNSIAATFVTIRDLIRLKSIVKGYTLEKAAKVPLMTDIRQKQIMCYLDRLATCMYISGDSRLAVNIFKAAMVTDQYGLCDESPTMLVMTGLIFAATGDYESAQRFTDYSLALLLREARNSEPRAKFIAGVFVLAWTRPYHFVQNLMLESYHSGMSTGDLESAFYGIAVYVVLEYISGRRLSIVLEDCNIYSKQALEHKRDVVDDYLSVFGQTALNLMGRSNHTTLLEGAMIQKADEFLEDMKDNAAGLGMFRTLSVRLSLVFEEYEKGADLFIDYGFDWPEKNPGHPLFMEAIFTGGICCYEMARRHPKRRKYRKTAQKAFTTLKGWCGKGNPNVQHYKALFDAEAALLGKKYDAAEKHFQDGIAKSARGGFVHDAAIGSELYANFLLTIKDDYEGGVFHMKKSSELYGEWGADRKVELLSEKLHAEKLYSGGRSVTSIAET